MDGSPMKRYLPFSLFIGLIAGQPISNTKKIIHVHTLTTGSSNQTKSGFSCIISMYYPAIAETYRLFQRLYIIASKFIHKLQSFRQLCIVQ